MEPERLAVLASRAVGVVMVLYTIYCVWLPLLLLAMVVVVVMVMCQQVSRKMDRTVQAKEKVVLITGCDTGIGHEAALEAAKRGLTVVAGCLDVTSSGAQRLAERKGMHVIRLDVTSDESVANAVKSVSKWCENKGLWAVINNAGFNRMSPVELTSMTTFQHVADVMLFGTVRVTKAFLPLLRRARGRIVTVSSDRGMITPANSSAYCIAKHGVEAFSDVTRLELKKHGVNVSVIQPGHFGGATSILDTKQMEAMQKVMDKDFQACSEDVRTAYGGQRAVTDIIEFCQACKSYSASDVTPVVDAMMHSVLSTQPCTRYAVQGTNGLVDKYIVLGLIRGLLPDAVYDFLMCNGINLF